MTDLLQLDIHGYLIAEGLSFISTEVLIILTSSASSLAAITTKFGKVDK